MLPGGLEPAERICLGPTTVLKFSLPGAEQALGQDFPLRHLLLDGVYIAGGSVRDWVAACLGRPVEPDAGAAEALAALFDGQPSQATDIDIYFADTALLPCYRRHLEEIGGRVLRERSGLVDLALQIEGEWRLVQLVGFRNYFSAAELIGEFDFTVCQFAAAREASGLWFYAGAGSFEDLTQGTLRVNRLLHPLGTMRRLLKYARKGFNAPDETLVAIAREVARHHKKSRSGYE